MSLNGVLLFQWTFQYTTFLSLNTRKESVHPLPYVGPGAKENMEKTDRTSREHGI